jgi:hypothetical protein
MCQNIEWTDSSVLYCTYWSQYLFTVQVTYCHISKFIHWSQPKRLLYSQYCWVSSCLNSLYDFIVRKQNVPY